MQAESTGGETKQRAQRSNNVRGRDTREDRRGGGAARRAPRQRRRAFDRRRHRGCYVIELRSVLRGPPWPAESKQEWAES